MSMISISIFYYPNNRIIIHTWFLCPHWYLQYKGLYFIYYIYNQAHLSFIIAYEHNSEFIQYLWIIFIYFFAEHINIFLTVAFGIYTLVLFDHHVRKQKKKDVKKGNQLWDQINSHSGRILPLLKSLAFFHKTFFSLITSTWYGSNGIIYQQWLIIL